jgi:protein AroM
MMKIGFATIGQSPRTDLVPYILEHLSHPVEALEKGVLDDLSIQEMASLDSDGDGIHMVTRLRDGSSVRLAYEKTLPRMQQVVNELVVQGAELIVILCGADWSPVKAKVPIINPGKLFPNLIQALALGKRLGVVKPSSCQVEHTIKQYQALGLEVVVTSAFPYGSDGDEQARGAAVWLRSQNVDMVWMTCVGMGEDMRQVIRVELGKSVVLARSILTHVVDEFVGEPSDSVPAYKKALHHAL